MIIWEFLFTIFVASIPAAVLRRVLTAKLKKGERYRIIINTPSAYIIYEGKSVSFVSTLHNCDPIFEGIASCIFYKFRENFSAPRLYARRYVSSTMPNSSRVSTLGRSVNIRKKRDSNRKERENNESLSSTLRNIQRRTLSPTFFTLFFEREFDAEMN